MTVVENISWSELLKHTNLTAQHGNDGNRIAMATETLQQTAHQFVKVLNERARLLANSAQFDTALRDAAAIRAILSGSGLGHLCAGDVHCQQGHHAAAISIYDQGLVEVPESDPYYRQLQQHRLTAISSNNKRVDLISRLPLDIVVTNILPRTKTILYSHSAYGPLYVSRAWWKRILQQPNGLEFYFNQEEHTFKTGHNQLVRFAPYVQSLSGAIFDGARLDDLFSRAHFSNLKRLELTSDGTIARRPFINGLQLIADSLTKLILIAFPTIQLRDILESCPNLVSLDINDLDVVTPSLASSRYPKMEKLIVRNVPEKALGYDDMVDLLSRFPSLLTFEISPMPESRVLTILHNHCPHLQRLYIGEVLSSENLVAYPHRKGITSAEISGGDDVYNQDDLIQFLHVHQNSLERIGFDGKIDHDNCIWKLEHGQVIRHGDGVPFLSGNDPTQSETSFAQLTSIQFSGPRPSTCDALITWLILHAPNLKSVSLALPYLTPGVAKAMTRPEHLSKLTITVMREDRSYCAGIIEFLKFHIAKGGQSSLEEISLCVDQSNQVTWLPMIFRLKCLKTLELFNPTILDDAIPTSVAMGQGCSALENLTLGFTYTTFADGVIQSLSKLPNLKCLRIGARSLSDGDLLALADFPRLEQLYLRYKVPESIMKTLRNHIPKVVIY